MQGRRIRLHTQYANSVANFASIWNGSMLAVGSGPLCCELLHATWYPRGIRYSPSLNTFFCLTSPLSQETEYFENVALLRSIPIFLSLFLFSSLPYSGILLHNRPVCCSHSLDVVSECIPTPVLPFPPLLPL